MSFSNNELEIDLNNLLARHEEWVRKTEARPHWTHSEIVEEQAHKLWEIFSAAKEKFLNKYSK